MGSFAPELQDGYFDLAFSISVIEHIPYKALDDFWRDHARVLASGGLAIHTIDLYLGDEPDAKVAGRLKHYREIPARYGLVPVEQPRSEEHTSELQSLMRISYAVLCLKKKRTNTNNNN